MTPKERAEKILAYSIYVEGENHPNMMSVKKKHLEFVINQIREAELEVERRGMERAAKIAENSVDYRSAGVGDIIRKAAQELGK